MAKGWETILVTGIAAGTAQQISSDDKQIKAMYIQASPWNAAEVAKIQTATFDTQANTTDGGYFLLYSADNRNGYVVYMDKTGSTPAPTGADTVGLTAVQCDISGATTDAEVAAIVATQIDALSDFGAADVSEVVTITNADEGFADDAADSALVPVGGVFALATTTEGTGAGIHLGDSSVDLLNGIEIEPSDAPFKLEFAPHTGIKSLTNLKDLYLNFDATGNQAKVFVYVDSN